MGNDDTLLVHWSQWLRAAGASQKTVDTRLGGIKSLRNHAGHGDPVSFTTMQIVGWLADCQSPWTRKTYYTSACAWHRWLIDQEFREDDPMRKVPKPPQPRGVPRPASTAALEAVLANAQRRTRAYVLLSTLAGMRVNEIAKFQGEHLDDEWLTINGKGSHDDAPVPVHPLIAQLRRGFPERGFWFPSTSISGHVTPNSVSRSISIAFRKAGYPYTAHQCRHWFGTHALRASKDLRVAQELLRHADISSTQIYTEVASRAKVEAVRRLWAS